jgi:hypothetical protein
MDEQGVKEYRIGEAVTADRNLFELIRPEMTETLARSALLRTVLSGITSGEKRLASFKHMWDLDIVLQYIRDGPPSRTLSLRQLQRRAAAVYMILIPTRPIGMLRMEVGKERWREDGTFVEVPTNDKMSNGRSKILLILRKLADDANLCPYTLYCLLKQEAEKRGVRDSLWCSEDGIAFASSSAISRLLRELLTEAGMSAEFTAYSFRLALITYLFDAGLTETEVNAFTGHSQNAHTAVTHYFHLNERWIGRKMAAGTLKVVRRNAALAIQADNEVRQVEERADFGEEIDAGESQAFPIPSSRASPARVLAQEATGTEPPPERQEKRIVRVFSSALQRSVSLAPAALAPSGIELPGAREQGCVAPRTRRLLSPAPQSASRVR